MRRLLVVISYMAVAILGWSGSSLFVSLKRSKADTLYDHGRELILKDSRQGKRFLEQQLGNETEIDHLKLRYLVAWAAFSEGNFSDATQKVHSILLEQDNKWLEANCLYLLGYLKKAYIGTPIDESPLVQELVKTSLQDAFFCFSKSYSLYSKMDQPTNVYLSLLGLASTKMAEASCDPLNHNSHLAAAEGYLHQADALDRELGLANSKGSYRLLLAQTYLLREDYLAGLKEVDLAIADLEKNGETQGVYVARISRASFLLRLGQIDEGYQLAKQIDKDLKTVGNRHLVAQNQINIFLAKKCRQEDHSKILADLKIMASEDLTLYIQLSSSTKWLCP